MAWTDKLPELIIGGVVIAGGGFLISKSIDMSRSLGGLEAKVDAKLTEHSGRIDRIAAVLPDVRVKVAKDDLARPITTALVVTEPTQGRGGKWATSLHVIDAAGGKRDTYVIPVKGPQDREVAWLASGAAVEADPSALSIKTLLRSASDAGTPLATPGFVSTQNSYLLRGATSTEYRKLLEETVKRRAAVKMTFKLPQNLVTFEKLTVELANNQAAYAVPESY